MVVLGDHVGIPALLKAMKRQGKRQYVQGKSVMRTEIVNRRNANSNITVPWTVNLDSCGTVFGQPMGRKKCGCQGVSGSSTVMNTLLRSCR